MLRLAILALSLASGALATFFMFDDGDVGGAVANVAEPRAAVLMQEVLVATSDLALGDVISSEALQWQAWPETAVNSAFVVRTARPEARAELAGRYVRGSFSAGEPIRPERLAEVDARLLSANLPAGRRAVALRVSAESTAGGFVLPNDRVDVLLTTTEASGGGNRSASTVIARNVRVLAIDQLSGSSDAGAVIGSTATLELAERQVEAVLAAAASGMLSLALRSVADHHLLETGPEIIAMQTTPAPSAADPAPEIAPRTVRVRRGIEVETVILR